MTINYILLALAIFSAALALIALGTILRVAAGKAHWNSQLAPFAQAFYLAAFGAGAVALFSAAFG